MATRSPVRPPAVSVVMPAHDAEGTIEDALLCLVAQDFDDFEVIVVDDGSRDGTARIVDRIASADGRFRRLWQERSGAGAARNAGMAQACGRYLLFLDADDLFEPSLVSTLYERARAAGADVSMCSADCFASDPAQPTRSWEAARRELAGGVYDVGQIKDRLYQCTSVVVWNKLFDAGFVARSQLRFQDLPRFNDALFTICALANAHVVSKTREVLVHYRVGHGASLVSEAWKHPLCDLLAFDAARDRLVRDGMLNGSLKRSFDTLCVDTVVWRLAQFARTSDEAARELFCAYFGTYERKWGVQGARWPYLRTPRYALERALIRSAGAEGLLRAARRDSRTRASSQSVVAEARFAADLFAEAFARVRSKGV